MTIFILVGTRASGGTSSYEFLTLQEAENAKTLRENFHGGLYKWEITTREIE